MTDTFPAIIKPDIVKYNFNIYTSRRRLSHEVIWQTKYNFKYTVAKRITSSSILNIFLEMMCDNV